MLKALFLVFCFSLCSSLILDDENFASQVHLSLGLDPHDMVVTWATPEPTLETSVIYGLSESKEIQKAIGSQTKFVDNGTLHHTLYFHRVVLNHLANGDRYTYRVLNGTDYGEAFTFIAMQEGPWAPRFTVYGDFGVENPESLPSLIKESAEDVSHVVVHVGDYAYDDWRDNSTWADRWFNMMQPIMAHQPYMMCPGNHETLYDFLNYRSRLTMPYWEITENLFFSWNLGLTHWIAYNTEVYFVYEAMEGHGGVHRNYGPYPEIAAAQLRFIEEDLIIANQNRHLRPWIIAYGHRPMYCSDNDDDDCLLMRNQWKTDLENLFYKYTVDVVIEAHQHSYERLWPVYNGVVMNGSYDQPYVNYKAPIHIVSGSAGCDENLDTFGPPLGAWSALRISKYGYGHLTAMNTTHLHWEQLYKNQTVADEIFIVKDILRTF